MIKLVYFWGFAHSNILSSKSPWPIAKFQRDCQEERTIRTVISFDKAGQRNNSQETDVKRDNHVLLEERKPVSQWLKYWQVDFLDCWSRAQVGWWVDE